MSQAKKDLGLLLLVQAQSPVLPAGMPTSVWYKPPSCFPKCLTLFLVFLFLFDCVQPLLHVLPISKASPSFFMFVCLFECVCGAYVCRHPPQPLSPPDSFETRSLRTQNSAGSLQAPTFFLVTGVHIATPGFSWAF